MKPRPSIGAGFIFRDHAATTGAMLASILRHVDEVVAVDTGSRDGTRELVEAALADTPGRIVEHAWRDHFSDARNAGWRLLEADWLLWIDCDETLVGGHLVRPRASGAEQLGVEALAWPQVTRGEVTLGIERLVKRSVGWEWQSPLGEHLVPARRVQARYQPDPRFEHHREHGATDYDRNERIRRKWPPVTLEWRRDVHQLFDFGERSIWKWPTDGPRGW